MQRRVIFILGVCFLFVGCGEPSTEQSSKPDEVEPAASAPKAAEVTTKLLTWKETQELVKSHQGKVVVLDVWSTSCPPCMREFPGLVDLQAKHKADVQCISVSLDFAGLTDEPSAELKQRVLAFLEKKKATFPNVICTDPDSDVYEIAEFNSLPAVYVFDRDGNLKKLFSHALDEFGDEGFTYEKHITPLVAQLLSEKQ